MDSTLDIFYRRIDLKYLILFLLSINTYGLTVVPPKEIDYFGASWCAPCKTTKPNLKKFAKKNHSIRITFHDTDKERELSRVMGIKSIPTLVFYVNGNQVARVVGGMTYKKVNCVANRVLHKKHKNDCGFLTKRNFIEYGKN